MNIVIVGHVDHGKSTIIGRLMADTNSLPKNKLEQIQDKCKRNSKPFEYAFLLDALKDEQEQGITIDIARCFFKTKLREYMILDAPGHIEFMKNMITGASKAEAALLVIDASEGIKENSKRHAYMLSMLGIKQISVLINKMDLVNYSQEIYKQILSDYSFFLQKIGLYPVSFIPVSGASGDNIKNKSNFMKWYNGNTVLEQLDLFKLEDYLDEKPFRMPIQGVYKFTNNDDKRRIVAGTVLSGNLSLNDKVVFYPSKKASKIKSFEAFNSNEISNVKSKTAVAFTLEDEIYIKRGEIVVLDNELKPQIATEIIANVFWLGKDPLLKMKKYYIKLATQKVEAIIEDIYTVLDVVTLEQIEKEHININEVGKIKIKFKHPIVFDFSQDILEMNRFIIVDNYEISGGGLIINNISDIDIKDRIHENEEISNNELLNSHITLNDRIKMYKQKSILILIVGNDICLREKLASRLEKDLFNNGKFVYFKNIDEIIDIFKCMLNLHNICKDMYVKILIEISKLILDLGVIFIVTTDNCLTDKDINLMEQSFGKEYFYTISVKKNYISESENEINKYIVEIKNLINI